MPGRSVLLQICALAILSSGFSGIARAGPPNEKPAEAAQSQPGIPNEYRLALMIKGTLIALNQANMTGNYTVLRELGTPNFQMLNSPARLAEIFAPLRNRKLDLAPIIFFEPKLIARPAIQGEQILRLTGFFATSPEQVNFDLAFQPFWGQWMLAGIAVNTVPANDAKEDGHTSELKTPSSSVPKSPDAARPANKAAATKGRQRPSQQKSVNVSENWKPVGQD